MILIQFHEASPHQARLFQTQDYCKLNPDGTVHTSVSHGYNRRDFVTFVIPARTWAAAVPQAVHLVKCRANKAFDRESLYYHYNYEWMERLKTILKYAQQKNVDRQYRILEMQIMSVVETMLTTLWTLRWLDYTWCSHSPSSACYW